MRRVERLFWLLLLLLSSDAFVYMSQSADGFSASGGGRSWVNGLFIGVYGLGIACWALAGRLSVRRSLLHASLPCFLMVMACVFSMAWSEDSAATLKQSVLFGLATAFCIGMYVRLGFIEAMKLLRTCIIVLAIMSVIAVVLAPNLAISYDNHEGSWKGVFAHKNTLGAVSSLGIVLCFGLHIACRMAPWRSIASIALLALTLFQSGSLTALLVAVASCAVGFTWLRTSGRGRQAWRPAFLALGLFVTASMLAVVDLEVVAESFGKDSTATGRLPLWTAVWSQIMDRPWFGYGYSAFWSGVEANRGFVSRSVGFAVTHPHNGYLELVLAFGIPIGIGIVLAIGAVVMRAAALPFSRDRSLLLCVVVACYMACFNISETSVLASHGLFWPAMTLVLIQMCRTIKVQRARDANF